MDSFDKNEKDLCLMETHFLNPHIAPIDGLVAELPRSRLSVSSSDQKEDLLSRVSFTRFWTPSSRFMSWALKMEALHKPTWEKAGILEAIKASTYGIRKNSSLILALVEKWCPETKSFIFPWGEATITLENVMVLLGFSVLGSPVFAPLEESSEMRGSVREMERVMQEGMRKFGRVSQVQWISTFRNGVDPILEHEAFLAFWLSHAVFPEMSRSCVSRNVLPIAVRLARGEKVALAPAVLASLYRDLGQVQAFARDKWFNQDLNLTSLFELVQVWAWERFRDIRPEATPLREDEPRIARWSRLNQSYEEERLCFDCFVWRPYAKDLENWRLRRFYVKEAKWVTVDDSLDDEFVSFARCLRVSRLVGIGIVEDYYPHRVTRQFGLAQDLPGLVTRRSNFTEKEAWDDYNKPLDGLKLYIPSRLAKTSVTARYQDWWLKSVSEFLHSEESTETFNSGCTVDDDDDAPLKVLPLSQVLQKLGDGFPAKLKRRRKMITAKNVSWEIKQHKIGDCGVSDSGQVPLSELFQTELVKGTSEHLRNKRAREDENSMDCCDNMTIPEMIRCRKKSRGDAFESLGKRSRKFQVVDSEDSEPWEKFKQMARKVRICDDDEVDVNGSNAEKKTSLIDDSTKEVEYLHHEDSEKKRSNDDDDDERWKQRKLAIEELAMNLEARMVKMQTTLAVIRKWKTRRNHIQTGVYA